MNELIDDNIKILELIKKTGLLIGFATETVKPEIKKQEGGFLGAMMASMAASLIITMASSLIVPMASSLINAIIRKWVMRAGKRQEDGFLSLLALPLLMKVLGKRVTRVWRGCSNLDKHF